MRTIDVKNINIAKKYSTALFEAVSENGKAEIVMQNLIFIDETLKTNEQLFAFFNNPIITRDDKKDVAQKIFAIHIEKIVLDLLFVLIDNARIDAFDEIVNQYAVKYDVKENIVKPNIISAVELTEEQKQKVVAKLQNKLNKQIIPNFIIDENIIAGMIIEIDDKVIDFSLKEKFEQVQKQLVKGN